MHDSRVEKLILTDESGIPKIVVNTANSDLFSMGFQAINTAGEAAFNFYIDRMVIIKDNQIRHVIECVKAGELALFYLRKVAFQKVTERNEKGILVEVEKPLCEDFLKPMGRIAAHLLIEDFVRAFPEKQLHHDISIFENFDSIHFKTLEACIKEEEQCGRGYQGVIPIYARYKVAEPGTLKINLKNVTSILAAKFWSTISDQRAKEAIQIICSYSNKENLLYPPPNFKDAIEYLIETAKKYKYFTLEQLLIKIRKSRVLKNWEAYFVSTPPEWLISQRDMLTNLTMGISCMTAEFLGTKEYTGSITAVTTGDGAEYWIALRGNASLVIQVIRETNEKKFHSSWSLTKHLLNVLTKIDSGDISVTNYDHKISSELEDTKYRLKDQKQNAISSFKTAAEYSLHRKS